MKAFYCIAILLMVLLSACARKTSYKVEWEYLKTPGNGIPVIIHRTDHLDAESDSIAYKKASALYLSKKKGQSNGEVLTSFHLYDDKNHLVMHKL